MADKKINILVTLDENYIPYLNVMLTSLIFSNQDCFFDVYLLHSSVRECAVKETERILKNYGRLIMVQARDIGLENVPTTGRYPQEIYYRIFAARYLPEDIDRILYLDPDIISGLYGNKIQELDTFRYNMTEILYQLHAPVEREMNMEWIRKNAVIIHYCGRNKPWKEPYIGQLDIFYKENVERMKIRVR